MLEAFGLAVGGEVRSTTHCGGRGTAMFVDSCENAQGDVLRMEVIAGDGDGAKQGRNEEQGGGFNSISPDRDSLTRGTINISQFTLHISSRFLGRYLSPLSLLSTPIWTTAAHATLSRDPPSD